MELLTTRKARSTRARRERNIKNLFHVSSKAEIIEIGRESSSQQLEAARTMPLHLLSKKSWNVYAPDNIARVKRDQAAAQAREEEEDRWLQEQDSERRLAALRGASPLPRDRRGEDGRDSASSRDGDRRKRKRIAGEDDTDRDMRLAREDALLKHRHMDEVQQRRKAPNAPLMDSNGHIDLFPDRKQRSTRDERYAVAEADRARKQREYEDQYTMRFSNASGRGLGKTDPWYASYKRQRGGMEFIEGEDAWGKPDPSAKDREQARQSSNDPLAFMQKAQTQLRRAQEKKRKWHEEEQGKSVAPDRRDLSKSRRDPSRERARDDGRSSRRHTPMDTFNHDRRHGQSRRTASFRDEDRRSERRRSRAASSEHEPTKQRLAEVIDDFRLDR